VVEASPPPAAKPPVWVRWLPMQLKALVRLRFEVTTGTRAIHTRRLVVSAFVVSDRAIGGAKRRPRNDGDNTSCSSRAISRAAGLLLSRFDPVHASLAAGAKPLGARAARRLARLSPFAPAIRSSRAAACRRPTARSLSPCRRRRRRLHNNVIRVQPVACEEF